MLADNPGDPKAFAAAVEAGREKSGISKAGMLGERGIITSAPIRALKEILGMA